MRIPNHLYRDILASMPIACVDVIASDGRGDILLVQRRNTPARGQWWFPGGRILYLEKRVDAARRKLREECGLVPEKLAQAATCTLLLDRDDGIGTVHSITTIYRAQVGDTEGLRLDEQSSRACWKSIDAWRKMKLHPFVRHHLIHYGQRFDA